MIERLQDFIDGAWRPSRTTQVLNPASAQVLAEVPLSEAAEVHQAAEAAARAFAGWRPGDRVQPLLRLKTLLESNLDKSAHGITDEPEAEVARTETFGPVLSLMHAETIEQAIDLVNRRSYGNMACVFTSNGARARRFRYEVNAANVGINVGVAAPMSSFPFSGWSESFCGDLHAQAKHGVGVLYPDQSGGRGWPQDWSRKF